jgi:lysophospholipase L1-like esterase
MKEKKGNIRKRLFYICYLIAITFIALEILLRFYYPFQRKIRGNKWKLSTNTVYRLQNIQNPRLDQSIVNRRNSIGFRGEDPTSDINNRLTILTVGGSSTACNALTEGKTWTDILGGNLKNVYPSVWINNAGFDGHSTYGHLNFLHNYLPTLSFKPRVIIFLFGANDMDRNDLSTIDSSLTGYEKLRRWFENHSETVNLFIDLKWIIHPVGIFKDRTAWDFTNFKALYLTKEYIDSALQKQNEILPAYRKRLCYLVELCSKNNILPVFVTQPLVFGDGTPEGGNPVIDFHECKPNENGQLGWKKLSLYNDVTRQVSNEKKIHYIDLAELMPKDTLYYYDMVHFTNAGSQKVADILFENLNPYLSEKFPQYIKH